MLSFLCISLGKDNVTVWKDEGNGGKEKKGNLVNSLAFWHGTDMLSINCWFQVCYGSKFQVRENSTFLSSQKREKIIARGLQHYSAGYHSRQRRYNGNMESVVKDLGPSPFHPLTSDLEKVTSLPEFQFSALVRPCSCWQISLDHCTHVALIADGSLLDLTACWKEDVQTHLNNRLSLAGSGNHTGVRVDCVTIFNTKVVQMIFGAPGLHILSCGLRSLDILCMVFLPSISGSPQISACLKAYHSFVNIFANMTIVVCMFCLGYYEMCCSRIWSYFPGLGRSPGEENGNPLQYSCRENPTYRGAWWATIHGVARVRHDLATTPPPPR